MVVSSRSDSPASALSPGRDGTDAAVRSGFEWGKYGFGVVLLLALIGVFLSGRFAYREASLFHQAKGNGQSVLQWATGVAARKGHAHAACAGVPHALVGAAPLSWAQCRAQLLAEQGPLSALRNPFGAQAPALLASCERGHYAGRGAVALEKGTASPPGFPPSVSYAPLEDEEVLVKGLLLRVLVCDPSGYGVRIGEAKL